MLSDRERILDLVAHKVKVGVLPKLLVLDELPFFVGCFPMLLERALLARLEFTVLGWPLAEDSGLLLVGHVVVDLEKQLVFGVFVWQEQRRLGFRLGLLVM